MYISLETLIACARFGSGLSAFPNKNMGAKPYKTDCAQKNDWIKRGYYKHT